MILIDAFAGAGGNSIAFAKTGKWKRVYAIEKDPVVLQCAKHNAKIYGVDKQITWFEGDCFQILKNQLRDLAPYSILFASPPWGGMYCLLSSRKALLTQEMQDPVTGQMKYSTFIRWSHTRLIPSTRSFLSSPNMLSSICLEHPM